MTSGAYYSDEEVTLHHGDALEVLRGLPDGSVDCCVTSPPYYGLRDYGVDGQYGAEASPAEYVERLRVLFAEVRRVLAVDGTLWLNLGDSYSGGNRATYDVRGGNTRARGHARSRPVTGVPAKNLLGVPWRVAFALQDDGWILRNDLIWHKPNAMPESVRDRFSTRYEHVFLFARSKRYWFDLDAVREERLFRPPKPYADKHQGNGGTRFGGNAKSIFSTGEYKSSGKNPGDVWSVSTQPFTQAHFAVMSPTVVERCVLAGCKPGGVVLDPFSGSGTTGMVALHHGRRYVGVDLNREYLDLSLRTRLAPGGVGGDSVADGRG